MCFSRFCLTALLLGLVACQTTGPRPKVNQTMDLRAKIQVACYEVVVKKPEKDSLAYEKELPWELIDYNIRNDQYWPLGTAFAVSDTELVTAAHVLQLMEESPYSGDMYIRDAGGNVYPIDQLLSFHSSKDFVKFTAKGKSFETWLTLRPDYAVNESVLAVGNIYGQGLVSVPGTLLGTLPEQENGRWLYLKSSPPNDRGSSGGPLLDRDGNVIGIIISKDDNFSYSLPVSEMENLDKSTGIVHEKVVYGFHLFPEKIDPIPFDHEVALPAHYREVKRNINRSFSDQYRIKMEKLFADNREEIFPRGKSSLIALDGSCNATDLQVLYKNEDDLTWYFSNIRKEHSSLDKNGSVIYANIKSTFFIDLVKPDDVSLKDLYSNPKIAMDLILKGIRLPRTMAEQKIRILSLGNPMSSAEETDAFGRKWMVNLWSIEYSDQAGILYSAPTPDGMVCLLKFVDFSQRDMWLYDLKKTLDFVYIPYYGTLEQWSEFLGQKDLLYGAFLKAKLDYKPDAYFHLAAGEVRVDLDTQLLKIADKTRMSLMHDFYPHDGKIVWGMRSILYSEENHDNYFMVYRHLNPHPELPDRYKRHWESVVQKGHPYDEVPFANEGRTNAGFVHPKYTAAKGDGLKQRSWIHTVYLGKEGNIPEERMTTNLNLLKKEIKID